MVGTYKYFLCSKSQSINYIIGYSATILYKS